MFTNVKKLTCALMACGAIFAACPGLAYAEAGYKEIFILGDSVSDSGNRYLMTGETTKSPYPLIPTYPYAMGGHHYSNGKTWAERIAQELNDVSGGKASLANPGKNGNYAYGGARGRTNPDHPSPDGYEQAQTLLVDNGGASPDALYVIQFGGNDVRDALDAANSDASLATSFGILFGAVYEVKATINLLYAAGARHFMIANSPNLANAPAVSLAPPIVGFLTGIFVGTYNGELENRLLELEANPGIVLHRFDMYGFTNELVSNPGEYGLTNVASPCLNFLAETGGKCENPEQYLFWDGFHPTAAAHRAIAAAAMKVLNGP